MSDVFLCFVVVNMFHTTTDSINCYFFPSLSFYNRPKAAPYYGGTSLFIQCSKGNIEMVQTLIKNGIDINAIHPYTKVGVECRMLEIRADGCFDRIVKEEWREVDEEKCCSCVD